MQDPPETPDGLIQRIDELLSEFAQISTSPASDDTFSEEQTIAMMQLVRVTSSYLESLQVIPLTAVQKESVSRIYTAYKETPLSAVFHQLFEQIIQ